MEEITIKDIARLCGVGVSTVSRAINNHPDISQETKDMILQMIEKYNYIPNNSARNLKRSDSKTIAVLVKGITNPFFNSIIKAMEAEIQKKKYTLVLHHVDLDEDEVQVALQLVKEKRLRGIVFLGGQFYHTDDALNHLQVPFILSTIGGIPEKIDKALYSSVSVDDVKESYKAVDYLCKLGHRKIATITASPFDTSIGHLRLKGYLAALENHHIPVSAKLICAMDGDYEEYSLKSGYAATKKLLESGEEFTAIFAISDMLAIGACKAILDAGKRIPEDYSIVGFDGIEMSQYYSPTLTTLKQPGEAMGLETIRILFDVIRHKNNHQHSVFPGELLIGSSTRAISTKE